MPCLMPGRKVILLGIQVITGAPAATMDGRGGAGSWRRACCFEASANISEVARRHGVAAGCSPVWRQKLSGAT